MPYKDPEKRKQNQASYGAKWYQKHKELTIARTKERKHTTYAGTCINCGATTVGTSKKRPGSNYCSKPECRSAQQLANREVFVRSGRAGAEARRQLDKWRHKEVVSLDELQEILDKKERYVKNLRRRRAVD